MLRIIHVEDNPSNQALIERIADMGNYEVVIYTEAETALANIEYDAPDVVLADFRLAGEMDGLEMARRLRAAGYENPIIALTAYATERECYEAGCDNYFEKPVPVQNLLEVLNYYAGLLASNGNSSHDDYEF